MALDKLVDSAQLDSDLTSVANAIRAKSGGSSQLAFPAGFVSEIQAIPSGGGGSILPDAYQRCEYVENTNTAMIDTGWKRVDSTKIEIEASFNGGQSSTGILVGFVEGAANWFGINTSNELLVGPTAKLQNTTYSAKNSFDISFSASDVTVVCGNDSTTRSGTVVSNVNLCIFAVAAKTYNCKAKVYSIKISDRDTIVRIFIPCYRKADGVIGFYDVLNNVFYTNGNTSGSFTKGPDVLTDSETLAILLGGAT